MRLTRCLLRYGGTPHGVALRQVTLFQQHGQMAKTLSGVGFEPTPSIEDQNSPAVPYQGTRHSLESGALDHSANLTVWLRLHKSRSSPGQKQKLSRARLELATFCV